jgi:ribose transport system substrate-binding protein
MANIRPGDTFWAGPGRGKGPVDLWPPCVLPSSCGARWWPSACSSPHGAGSDWPQLRAGWAPNLQARVAGVRRAAERLGVEIVGVYSHEETAVVAAVAEVIRVNREHPEIEGWALVGGWPMFRSSASLTFLRDLRQRDQKLAAMDGLPDQLHYAEKGIAVLLAQPVYDWGTVCVSTIVDHVALGKPVSEYVEMKLVRVTANNLGDWARRLASWGFALPEDYLTR